MEPTSRRTRGLWVEESFVDRSCFLSTNNADLCRFLGTPVEGIVPRLVRRRQSTKGHAMSARLMEGLFGGTETFRLLVMDGEFTVELGAAIRAPGGGGEPSRAPQRASAPRSPSALSGTWRWTDNQRSRGWWRRGLPLRQPRHHRRALPPGAGRWWEAVLVGFGRRAKTSEVEAELVARH